MGISTVLFGCNFAGKNLGQVTFTQQPALLGITIECDNIITGQAQASVVYSPFNASDTLRGATWGLYSDLDCTIPIADTIATISDGLITIIDTPLEGVLGYIKAVSVYDTNLNAIKPVTLFLGYTQLNYLRSSGGLQYIATNFTPGNNSRMILEYEVANIGSYFALIRELTDAFVLSKAFGGDGATYTRAYYGAQVNSSTFGATYDSVNTKRTLDIDKNLIYINNNLVATYNQETFTCLHPLVLFARVSNGVQTQGSSTIYSCKLYESGVLIRDFIPVLRDGVPMMFDLVESKYYPNAGTGEFLYGPL